jgi:hypothetical protein
MLDLEHYIGVWDGKWECNLASTVVMSIECSYVLYSNRVMTNTNNKYVVQIGIIEKKHVQQN